MGTSRRTQGPMSVPSRDILLSIWLTLGSWTVNYITDRVSLLELAAGKTQMDGSFVGSALVIMGCILCPLLYCLTFFLFSLLFQAN